MYLLLSGVLRTAEKGPALLERPCLALADVVQDLA